MRIRAAIQPKPGSHALCCGGCKHPLHIYIRMHIWLPGYELKTFINVSNSLLRVECVASSHRNMPPRSSSRSCGLPRADPLGLGCREYFYMQEPRTFWGLSAAADHGQNLPNTRTHGISRCAPGETTRITKFHLPPLVCAQASSFCNPVRHTHTHTHTRARTQGWPVRWDGRSRLVSLRLASCTTKSSP